MKNTSNGLKSLGFNCRTNTPCMNISLAYPTAIRSRGIWDYTKIEESMSKWFQDRVLQWFGHLERGEETTWSSKCRTFKVSGSFYRRQPWKTWNLLIRSNLKEKVNKDIAKDRYAWKSFSKNRPTHSSMKSRN